MKLRNTSVLICVFLAVTTFFNDVNGGVALMPEMNGESDATSRERSAEYFEVIQVTPITRRKRDATVDHVDFPSHLDFSLRFESGHVTVRLKRNDIMTSNIKLSNEEGQIKHDFARKTGIYSDLETMSAFVVRCEDDEEHCFLQGSMAKDGQKLDITPERHTPKLHKAVQNTKQTTSEFDNRGVQIPGFVPLQANEKQENLNNLNGRTKRDIPSGCEIVECLAIADETIWNFHLAYANGAEESAHDNLYMEYLALYTQADLHFDYVSRRRPGACIRLYLDTVVTQQNRTASWSAPNELGIPGLIRPVVAGTAGLITCGEQGNACRNDGVTADLIQCFTRKDIAFDETGSGDLLVYHRSVGFRDMVCNDQFLPYQSAIIEQYGDKVERLIAHEVGHGLGADHDSQDGCWDNDTYIMASEVEIPVDDLKLRNLWYFSVCSLDEIYAYLATQPACLRDNSFTEDEYNSFANRTLAGQLYDWNTQCQYRFNVSSERCDPLSQNREYLPDMCSRGVYCTEPLREFNCTGVMRPYDGTPCGDLGAYCWKGECFTPPRSIGSPCDCNSECLGNFTYCSSSGICSCQDGYYEAGPSGCLPKIGNGDACSNQNACSDPNANCTATCQCNTGFYNNNGTCDRLLCVGETCNTTSDCRGNNVECSGSPPTCRCPTDRYMDVETGDCLSKKSNGESCEPGQCASSKAICDPNTNKCSCANGYYDTDGVTIGGACDLKKGLDVACSQPDACADPNAICSSTCQCNTGFYNNAGTCEPLSCIGETCNATSDCRGNNVECSGTPLTCRCPADRYIDVSSGDCLPKKGNGESCEPGQCASSNAICNPNTNICSCTDGYYDTDGVTIGGDCELKKDLGIACSQPDACADPNAICSSTCQCNTGFYNNAGTCETLLCIGETCNATSDCRGNNVECSGTPLTCRCPADRYIDVASGDCLPKKSNGESCEPGQCASSNAICDPNTNICSCTDGYYDTDGVTIGGDCELKKGLGIACSQPDACADPNAVCSSTCQCNTGFYNNTGTCETLLCIGETCSATSDCQGNNVECSGNPLTCRCPADRYIDVASGDCLPKRSNGESCEPGQCASSNAICDPNTNICSCTDGYYDTDGVTIGGDCELKKGLGIACSQPDACADPNAICSSTCQCNTGFYNNAGTCDTLLCIGENCSATSDCRGNNVECSGTPLTCRCSADRYLDVASGDCLPKKSNLESCEPGQCGTSNAFCDPNTNLCTCANGFYDTDGVRPGGDCEIKNSLDVPCSVADSCADPNAICSITCQCNTGFYNNAGTCEPLLCIGETCSATSDCRGNDVECSGTPLSCRCPADRYLDVASGDCLLKKGFEESCEPGQCSGDSAVCNPTTSLCDCFGDFKYDTIECIACPASDWLAFEGSCYFFGDSELNYEPARVLCDTYDTGTIQSNLVQVDTTTELAFLKNFMTTRDIQPTSGYFNDLYQTTTDGNEVWRTTGDPLVVSDWNPGQPADNGGQDQRCTIFLRTWNYRQGDFDCATRRSIPVCEVTPP